MLDNRRILENHRSFHHGEALDFVMFELKEKNRCFKIKGKLLKIGI